MMFCETKAVFITRKNYWLAVATLPAGFQLIPTKDVFGCVLVMNDWSDLPGRPSKRVKNVFSNVWVSKEHFDETFTVVDKRRLNKKTPVTIVRKGC